jgi:hypothetical protein
MIMYPSIIVATNGAPNNAYKTLYIAQLGTPARLAQINIIRRSRESSSSIKEAPISFKNLNICFMKAGMFLEII